MADGDPSFSPGERAAAAAAGRGKLLVLATMAHPSGAPMAALRLAAGLEPRGWDARAAFLYELEPIARPDHAYACLLDHPPRSASDLSLLVRRLDALIAAERPDAVIGFLPLASILGAAVARRRGVRVRLTSHRVPVSTYARPMRALDLAAAWSGTYTGVIAVSHGVAAQAKRYPDRLRCGTRVIHNGLKDWRPSPLGKAEARARLGLSRDAFLLAAVGRLDPQKNYSLLIDAMARAPAGCVLAVAGDGPLRAEIEADVASRGLADRVLLLGALPRESVPDLLAAADLFAQPSLFEGQSNALLEALYAGLPCLVSDIPEQVETVTDDRGRVAGAVLPLGEPAAWADAVARFRDAPAGLDAAREAAARQATAFSFDRMTGGFDDLLVRELAAARL